MTYVPVVYILFHMYGIIFVNSLRVDTLCVYDIGYFISYVWVSLVNSL
jgi:hypothetical protein